MFLSDHTARIWCVETGSCLLQYTGHIGSVNSLSFNPNSTNLNDLIVVTSSGDQSAHIWKANLVLPPTSTSSFKSTTAPVVAAHHSSEDELDPLSEREDPNAEGLFDDLFLCIFLFFYAIVLKILAENEHCVHVRSPSIKLTGHTSAVICADWLMGGNQVRNGFNN